MSIPSSASICGDEVFNRAGETLGEIKELMIDCESGQVGYAVLEFGGFPGLGAKLFAVPMDALRVDTQHKRFVLDIDEERLAQAPGFDKDNWPDFANPALAQAIHHHYGVPRG